MVMCAWVCVCLCVWLFTWRSTRTGALTKGWFFCGRVYRDKLGGDSAPAAHAVAWAGARPSAKNDGLDR
jgi:hypothetical protein